MCTSQVAGFKLIVHNQTEAVFPDADGFNIAPGRTTIVKLAAVQPPPPHPDSNGLVWPWQTELRNLPEPYGNCSGAPGSDYLYNGSYTVEVRGSKSKLVALPSRELEGCLRSCYQGVLAKACGCYDARFAAWPNATACGLAHSKAHRNWISVLDRPTLIQSALKRPAWTSTWPAA